MKPLETNRQILIWLYMCSSSDEDWDALKKIYRIVFALTVFIFNMWVVTAHLAYFWRFWSTKLDESLYALTNATAFSVVMYVTISAFFSRHETSQIFKDLWKIYRARAY